MPNHLHTIIALRYHRADAHCSPFVTSPLYPWHLPGQRSIFVKALLSKPTIEGFYESIVCWLPGTDEIQGYAAEISPLVHISLIKHGGDSCRDRIPTSNRAMGHLAALSLSSQKQTHKIELVIL